MVDFPAAELALLRQLSDEAESDKAIIASGGTSWTELEEFLKDDVVVALRHQAEIRVAKDFKDSVQSRRNGRKRKRRDGEGTGGDAAATDGPHERCFGLGRKNLAELDVDAVLERRADAELRSAEAARRAVAARASRVARAADHACGLLAGEIGTSLQGGRERVIEAVSQAPAGVEGSSLVLPHHAGREEGSVGALMCRLQLWTKLRTVALRLAGQDPPRCEKENASDRTSRAAQPQGGGAEGACSGTGDAK